MKYPDWIKLKHDVQPNVFRCDRCGEERELHLPAAVEDVLSQGKAFTESHKYCKEPE